MTGLMEDEVGGFLETDAAVRSSDIWIA